MVGLIVSNYLHRDTTLSRESAAKLGFIRFEQPRSIDLPTLAFQDGSPVTQSAFVGGWNFCTLALQPAQIFVLQHWL